MGVFRWTSSSRRVPADAGNRSRTWHWHLLPVLIRKLEPILILTLVVALVSGTGIKIMVAALAMALVLVLADMFGKVSRVGLCAVLAAETNETRP